MSDFSGKLHPYRKDTDDPLFSGVSGGDSLLREYGIQGPIVDVGQLQIKILSMGQKKVYPRNMNLLPMADSVNPEQFSNYTIALAHFIAESIMDSCPIMTNVSGLILALPCAIDEMSRLSGCSYPGLATDAPLLVELASFLGKKDLPIVLLNDAELAAYSAVRMPQVPRPGKTLVLTLGFGVGGAVIDMMP